MAPSQIKPWIGGNWKCNGVADKLAALCKLLEDGAQFDPKAIDVVVFPPAVYVSSVVDKMANSNKYKVGVQNICEKGFGAYTGEICIDMVKDIQCSWTLIGHSERRQLFSETDAMIAKKVEECQKQNLCCAICIGETLEERDANQTMTVLKKQLSAVLPYITNWSTVVIAYEPVWAIGTGKTATPEVAQSVHKEIRQFIASNAKAGENVRIVYGGSVNAENASSLAMQPDINGFLVGGASLKPDFLKIIQAFQ